MSSSNSILDLKRNQVIQMNLRYADKECPVDKVEGDEKQGEHNPCIALNITGMEGEEVGRMDSFCHEVRKRIQQVEPLLDLKMIQKA